MVALFVEDRIDLRRFGNVISPATCRIHVVVNFLDVIGFERNLRRMVETL